MLSFDVKSFLERAETEVRAGRGPQVRLELAKINVAQVPSEHRLPLANLCRRVGLTSTAMRLLTAKIRGDASSSELAEYAVLLQKVGSLDESLRTLNQVDSTKAPEALLYRAFYHFSRWEHAEAIPFLVDYLESPLTDYAMLVGRLNLAAAYSMSGQWELALELAIECQLTAKAAGHWRILANCLELKAEIALQTNFQGTPSPSSLQRVKEYLEEASLILSSHKSFDQLFVGKWRAYVEGLERASVAPLTSFRQLAIERREWESVREADLFAQKINPDSKLLEHLIFGTPQAGYRKRAQKILGCWPTQTLFQWGTEGGEQLDIRTWESSSAPLQAPGKKIHLLIELLTRDFYRPLRVGHIFSEIYSDQHFDIFSSPGRVYQLVKRARTWLTACHIPVAIAENRGTYSLQFNGPFSFLVPLERDAVSGFAAQLNKLKLLYPPGRSFSNSEARASLGVKASTIKNIMAWAQREKCIARSGRSSATRYHFAKAG